MRLLMALCSLVGVGAAYADPVGYFGATLLISREGKPAGRIVYRPDHSYTMLTGDGNTVAGDWTAEDGKLCLAPNDPRMKRFGLCVPDDPVHKLGDAWEVPSPGGGRESLRLVAGQ